jgi:hypothetical protein
MGLNLSVFIHTSFETIVFNYPETRAIKGYKLSLREVFLWRSLQRYCLL